MQIKETDNKGSLGNLIKINLNGDSRTFIYIPVNRIKRIVWDRYSQELDFICDGDRGQDYRYTIICTEAKANEILSKFNVIC